MIKKILPFSFTALFLLCLVPGCANPPDTNATEERTAMTEANSEMTTDATQSGTEAATAVNNCSPSSLKGDWYDVNGETVLTIDDKTLTINSYGHPETYKYKIQNTPVRYIVPAEENGYFGILSDIEIREDGSLTAYEMVLDGAGHTFHFVRKEALEKEREIVDASKDAPKQIESTDIGSFSLVFHKSHAASYGLSDDWPTGYYSWQIDKNPDGTYKMNFRISGDSMIISDFSDEVSAEYVKDLAKLLADENIPQYNGYYKYNNVKSHSWSLYVDYESGEKLSVRADGDAASTCVFDLVPLLEYAAKQEFKIGW